MLNTVSLILSVSWMNLKNVRNRPGSSLVIIAGIGGVVAVLISLLAMAKGFETTLRDTGRADRALVLRAGSNSEINGNIPLDQFAIIGLKPQVARLNGSPNGSPNVSRETFVTVKLPDTTSAALSSVPMRGISPGSFTVRPELTITAGRKLQQGRFELLAGRGAAARIRGLEVGNSINIRGTSWRVVGHYETQGSAYESELWVSERILAELYGRGPTFSSMLVQLNTASDFDSFKTSVENDRRLTARVLRESDYYSAQSASTTQLIKSVGILIAIIMSVGAVFASFNTMYSAISTRTVEIATLRALGFDRLTIFCTVLVESLFLAAIGGLVGGLITFLVFNGYSVSTAGGTYTQVSFAFKVTPELLATGFSIAVLLGFIGGTIPAISAVRTPIVEGLKGV